MKVHSVGVVGAGSIAQSIHIPTLRSMPNVRVAWLTDADVSLARSAAAAHRVPFAPLKGSPENLPACDAVLLAIPVGVRAPYFDCFSGRGIAVLAEKPFAVTLQEHRRVVGLFAPEKLAGGYQRRTYANSRLMRDLVSSGCLGPLEAITINEGSVATATGRDQSYLDDARQGGGGILIELGSHAIDLAVFVSGASEHEVLDQDMVWDGQVDRRASGRVRLLNVNGRPGQACELRFNFTWLDPCQPLFELTFERARVRTGAAPSSPVEMLPRPGGRPVASLTCDVLGATALLQAYYLEWAEFLAGLENATPSCLAASNIIATTAILDALYSRSKRR